MQAVHWWLYERNIVFCEIFLRTTHIASLEQAICKCIHNKNNYDNDDHDDDDDNDDDDDDHDDDDDDDDDECDDDLVHCAIFLLTHVFHDS